MSKNLSNNFIDSFDQRVKTAYQATGKLKNSVRRKTGVIGSTHRFDEVGTGTATKRIPQTDVIPMNVVHGKATATLEDWNAPEYTDVFDKPKVHWDEQVQLATTVAGAIGRRDDQIIIDALEAAATSLLVDTDVGGIGSGYNTAKARRARRLLNDQDVPGGRDVRHAAISVQGIEQLLGEDEPTTFDRNAIKALVDGEITFWIGFTHIEISTRVEGGLPIAALVRTNFFYHTESTGVAVGIDFRTAIDHIPHKTSWLINGLFSAGAVAIQSNGIVEVDITEV